MYNVVQTHYRPTAISLALEYFSLYDFTVLDSLFNPRSIAVIGASNDTQKVGFALINNLKRFNFKGKVFPVNRKQEQILGLDTYGSVLDIQDRVDLAVISIPATYVPDTLRDCVLKGVESAVIISAGFKEAGAEGIILEKELKSVVRESGIRVLGPNCLGVINTFASLNATFAAGMLPEGRIAFFSQSGALGIAVLDWAIGNRIGFSKFISLGNKADLNETDFIEYFVKDPETDVILGYIEDVVDGRRFLDAARKATKIKPIILVKSGGTQAGARAASSHTGALAGSENAFNAAFKQTGIIRADGIEDLFQTAKAFSSKRIPTGNNLLIITNAGGPGIIAADTAEKLGINLPQLSQETLTRIAPLVPKTASLYNPIDIIGDATSERYAAVLENVMADPATDGFLVILTPQAMIDAEAAAGVVVTSAGKSAKPFITSFMGLERVRQSVEILKNSSIPNFSYPEPAVRAFKKLHDYAIWTMKKEAPLSTISADKEAVADLLRDARRRGQLQFSEDGSREILSAYGFRFPAKGLALTPREASTAASRIGFPVVMKISSPDILHKTDIGGVRIGINSAKEAREAFTEITLNARKFMPSAFINGVAVYETAPKGKEVIIGLTFDRTFGHMVMIGLGGIYVEVLKDVSFRIAPVDASEASDMLRELKTFPLLKGTRGERSVDIDSIIDCIVRISALASDFPIIEELDINPLVVNEKGALALDARIIIRQGKGGE